MPLGVVGTPAAILMVTLLVPFLYRYVWPRAVTRRSRFFAISLTLGLVVAAVAIFWFLLALNGAGIATGSTNPSGPFEAQLRTRFLTAAMSAFSVQYVLCRITQGFRRN